MILEVILWTVLYLFIGTVIAVLDAVYDMIRGRYDDEDGYVGLVVGWPILIIFGIIYAPCWLLTKFLDQLNDAIQQSRD